VPRIAVISITSENVRNELYDRINAAWQTSNLLRSFYMWQSV
jgi:hypothetical protein